MGPSGQADDAPDRPEPRELTGPVDGPPGQPGQRDLTVPAGDEMSARVWRRMRSLVLDLHERRREACEALDLSFIRIKALLALRARPATLGELATALATDRPYTTLTVHELERRGLVERTVHPEDRRSKIVELTPTGRAAASLADGMLNRPPAALADLGPADLAELDRITARLVDQPPA